MELITGVVNGVRNIRGEMNVPPATRVEVICLCESDSCRKLLLDHGNMIHELARLANLHVAMPGEMEKPRVAASTVVRNVEVYVLLKDILDFDDESKRLRKELSRVEKEYGITNKKLTNEDFLQKAPSEVIEKEKEKGARLGEKLEKLRNSFERINSLRESASAGD